MEKKKMSKMNNFGIFKNSSRKIIFSKPENSSNLAIAMQFFRIASKKLFFMIILFSLLSTFVFASVPQTFNVQGRLTDDSGSVLFGSYDMSFGIYSVVSGGSKLWEQNMTIATDSRGIYNVILSDVDVELDDQLFLGITVETDDEMTPRINLTSAPYSLTTSGLASEINLSHNVSFDSGTLFIDSTGNKVGIGKTSPVQKLDVDGGAAISGNLGIGTTGPLQKLDVRGKIHIDPNGKSTAQSGTVDIIEDTTSTIRGTYPSLTVRNRKMTTTSLADLGFIAGDGLLLGFFMADYLGSVLPSGGIGVRVETNHPLYFLTNDTTRMTVGNSGNVGIGTTAPTSLLDVFSTATTTVAWDSSSVTQGACIKIKDMDGGGYTYLTVLDGVLIADTVSCE